MRRGTTFKALLGAACALLVTASPAFALTSTWDGNNLTLTGTPGPDAIDVACEAGTVTANGFALTPVPAPCADVTNLSVNAGAGKDGVRLEGVTAAAFPALAAEAPHSIDVDNSGTHFIQVADPAAAAAAGDDSYFSGPLGATIGGNLDTGNDRFYPGPGDDFMFGGPDRDLIYGGRGDDRLEGGKGADRITGSLGRDLVFGDAGADALSGGPGEDIVRGGYGVNQLRGGTGDDRIVGGPRRDSMFGGDGDDLLKSGGAGPDKVIDCGDGHDVALIRPVRRTIHCEVAKDSPKAVVKRFE